ncbi:hypothetical protein NTGBS_470015 [Candidatus Nitrotoga sp. BS]|nr:hypothetical protein NTGBS_470015 [Candidatus Nitrotoga sp. BS]
MFDTVMSAIYSCESQKSQVVVIVSYFTLFVTNEADWREWNLTGKVAADFASSIGC